MPVADAAGGRHGAFSAQQRAERAAQTMLGNDPVSRRLGMALDAIAPGYARMRMRVGGDMLNGHSTCHGGFLFSLADSAFAFACNSYNQVAVASSATIEFLLPAGLDDELTAEARVISQGRRTGVYDVEIVNQRGERLALFRGRAHRLGRVLFDEAASEADTPSDNTATPMTAPPE